MTKSRLTKYSPKRSMGTNTIDNIRVGIDARILSRLLTGIGRYTLEMCHALKKIEHLSLFLYSPAPILNEHMQYLAGAHIHASGINNILHRQLWAGIQLPLQAKLDKIDVFWGPAHSLPQLLSPNIARVVTIHDLVWKYFGETMRPSSRLLENYRMPRAIHLSDQIAAVSQATANAVLKEFAIPQNKINVISPAANTMDNIAPPQKLVENGIDRPYCLFVGTHEPRKNLQRLLMAYAKLPINIKEMALLVIVGGSGWGNVQIDKLIKDLNISSHVRITGYVDDCLLGTLYANALFLAIPSLYEGFGMPIIEAMSYGTPVLTSNNFSMPEVAGKGGFLVDALSVTSIYKGLNELIGNKNLRQCLAANAKNNAAQYSWEKSAEQLTTVFERAIAIRNSRTQ